MKVFVLLATLAISVYAKPSRIVGGNDAKEGAYPYQISLQTKGWTGGSSHICGGSIIRPNIIITAGHCILNAEYVVKAGLWKQHNSNHVQSVEVEKIIVHEDFNGGVGPNDIAIIKLKNNLVYDEYVQPIALPTLHEAFVGDAKLSGWGKMNNNPFTGVAETLQEATIPLLTDKECADAFIKAIGESEPFSPESNICTGPLTGGLSACNGDSGGPLAQNGKLVGIVSWGMVPCGTRGMPAVFTEVSNFADWIDEKLQVLA